MMASASPQLRSVQRSARQLGIRRRSAPVAYDENDMILTEWGMAGVETLRERVAVLVIVDVLSFSTAVDVAVSNGAMVYPYPYGDKEAAQAAADRVGAVLAKPRRSSGGQFSLSPRSLMAVPAGTRIMLPSPNGARLSLACGDRPVLAGCLQKRRHRRQNSTPNSRRRWGGRGASRRALAGWEPSTSHRRLAGRGRDYSPSCSALLTRSAGCSGRVPKCRKGCGAANPRFGVWARVDRGRLRW